MAAVTVVDKESRKPRPKALGLSSASWGDATPKSLAEAPFATDFVDRRAQAVLHAGNIAGAPLTLSILSPTSESDWTKFSTGSEFVADITRRFGYVKEQFLIIGRELNRAKEILAHGEFLPIIQKALPFGEGVAEQLMAVAKSVDCQRIAVDRLPISYSVAYQLISLKDHELTEADKAGLVRPNVTRKEVLVFKRNLRSPLIPIARQIEIDNEIARLQKRIETLKAERASL